MWGRTWDKIERAEMEDKLDRKKFGIDKIDLRNKGLEKAWENIDNRYIER